MTGLLALLGLVLVLLGVSALTLTRRWSWVLLAFGAQSLGVGLIALTLVTLPVALVKSVSGWLAGGIFALTLRREGTSSIEATAIPSSPLFRSLLALMMAAAIVALLPEIGGLLGSPPELVSLAAGLLIGLGLLALGLTEQPLRIGVALLTTLQGFELAYLWSERSLLVVALLAAVELTVALCVTYLNAVGRQASAEAEPDTP